MNRLHTRLRSIPAHILAGLSRGIEKESLRVTPDGTLAATPHPQALGAALTHPHITTDFSESQLELITGVNATGASCIAELARIHQFVYRHIGDELLWCASMPCRAPDDAAIPIAQFGQSNVGRAKTVYRTGLTYRYGPRMQLISGIHYNFSVPEGAWPLADFADATTAYFALIRNVRRHGWLLMYLFGASPAVCASFVAGRRHELQELAPGTLYLPYATSLRMGRLGYQSEAQDALDVSYNDLQSYAASLETALTMSHPAYEAIGIRDGDRYRQLAVSLLQIENEFYSTVRPKRVVRRGERPLHALRERGVQYVEVRSLDLDPFEPVGINLQTLHFLDVFLLHCLLSDSPPDTPAERAMTGRNRQQVAARGREPGLRLERHDGVVELREWARTLLAECAPLAAAIDAARGGTDSRHALSALSRCVAEPESLPSARVLSSMRREYGGSHLRFALAHSAQHREALLAEPLAADTAAVYRRMANESLARQRDLEAQDVVPFETFRQRYIAPESLQV
jgi:glutamate--cysteine ligase